jgi:hypothetical protein
MQLHCDQIFKDFPTIFQQDVYCLLIFYTEFEKFEEFGCLNCAYCTVYTRMENLLLLCPILK